MPYKILRSGGVVLKSSAYVKPFSPLDVEGLTIWLDPSGLVNNTDNAYGTVASDGKVSALKDLTGKYPGDVAREIGASQSTSAYQPKVKFTAYDSPLPIIRMEWNSYMSFHEQIGTRSVFFINRHDTANSWNYAFFFGHYSSADFHGSTGSPMFNSAYASSNLINGQGYVNGVYTSPGAIQKSTVYNITSLVTAGAVNMSYLSRDRNSSNRNFDGLYGEILVYNRAVTTDERVAIENYLSGKWQIPLL